MSEWKPASPNIEAADVYQVAEKAGVIAIQLWPSWDPGSRALSDRLQRLYEEHLIALPLYSMDIDDEKNWPLAKEWNILNNPVLVCLHNGAFYECRYGVGTEADLLAKLQEWAALSKDRD